MVYFHDPEFWFSNIKCETTACKKFDWIEPEDIEVLCEAHDGLKVLESNLCP